MRLLSTAIITALLAGSPEAAEHPSHFIFFNVERHRIAEATFLETEEIVGAQLKYTWRELEPERDRYDFGPVLEDLEFLEEHGKRLFVQLQDVSFDERLNVPDYLIDDPTFGGGAARKYEFEGDDESKPVFDGWVARRWDSAVIARFAKLLQALGEELDGRIEGVCLAETSIGFGDSGELHPEGYSFESYANGVKAIMTAARDAFPESNVIQYANFMPGEWLPGEDNGYLSGVYEHGTQIGVGFGGPDLLPHRRGQQNHCLKFIAERKAGTVAGLAVQDGNLAEKNPTTEETVTVAELYTFAKDRLRLDYIFWGTQEPYYSEQIIPYLSGSQKD